MGKRDLLHAVFRGLRSLEYRSEEHTSELQSRLHLVCRLLLEKKKKYAYENSNSSPATPPLAVFPFRLDHHSGALTAPPLLLPPAFNHTLSSLQTSHATTILP